MLYTRALPLAIDEPPLTLQEEAYRRLEDMIVTLELAPGSVVSEATLGRRLGIGTTPVREALQRLSREHLVHIMPRRGVVVTAVDVALQLQILETRRELERLIVRLAARRATPSQCAEFASLAVALGPAAAPLEPRAFLRLDRLLDRLLAAAARNDVAVAAAHPLNGVSRRFWFFHSWDADLSESIRLHGEVARTISTGVETDAAAASDNLIEHLILFARATLPAG